VGGCYDVAMNLGRLHRTPREAVGELVRCTIRLCGRDYRYDRPTGLEVLFAHESVQDAFAADNYIPYWTELWPAASMLADAIAKEPWNAHRERLGSLDALELGCGLGLSGIVALAHGLNVTFTDVDAAAVQLAAHNARLNGFREFEARAVDIRGTPERLWPIILAADVLYEPRLVDPLIDYLRYGLATGGIALVGDADRLSARPFHNRLEVAGFTVQATVAKSGEKGSQAKGKVYRITREN